MTPELTESERIRAALLFLASRDAINEPKRRIEIWREGLGALAALEQRDTAYALLTTNLEADSKRLERRLAQIEAALEHYADELHWSLEPDPDPGNTGKPYYASFTYDGGHEKPWHIAREALRAEPAKDEG